MSYDGKSVLITGAGSGFGRRLAETLSGKGAKLVLAGVSRGVDAGVILLMDDGDPPLLQAAGLRLAGALTASG